MQPGTVMYKSWTDSPLPMYLRFYLFNVTNTDDVVRHQAKPDLVEMGPYTFTYVAISSILQSSTIVTFRFARLTGRSTLDSTLKPSTMELWNLCRGGRGILSLNSATERLMITLQHSTSLWWSVNRFIQPAIHQRSFFNFVFVNLRVFHKKGAAYSLRYAPLWFKVVFNRLISKYKSELFVTKTSRELLFDGYEDPLLDLAKHFPSGKFPPFDKFAWFYQVNSAFTVYAPILTNNEFMAICSVTIPIITTACSTSSLVLMTSTS